MFVKDFLLILDYFENFNKGDLMLLGRNSNILFVFVLGGKEGVRLVI